MRQQKADVLLSPHPDGAALAWWVEKSGGFRLSTDGTFRGAPNFGRKNIFLVLHVLGKKLDDQVNMILTKKPPATMCSPVHHLKLHR